MDSGEDIKDLLFGHGEDKMDLTRVRITSTTLCRQKCDQFRHRVEDLKNRIDSVIACLSSSASAETKWKAGLDAYSLVNIHLQNLTQSLQPVMARYVVCPIDYDPNAAVGSIESLLTSQLHPEQEKMQQDVIENMKMKDEVELAKEIERIDERNELIMDLIQMSRKPGSGLLDPKGPTRKRRVTRSGEIRQEIQQHNNSTQHSRQTQKKIGVCLPDASTGFGILTNAFLYGRGLRDE